MNREFLINVVFLLVINLLIKPFYIFGIDRTIQNEVGPEAYGLYFSLFSFAVIWQMVNDFGIQNFNNRNISRHRHLLGKYFPNIFALKVGLSAVYLLVVLVAAWASGYAWEVWPFLTLLALIQVLNAFVLFFRSNISGLGLYRVDSALSVLDRFLLILICGLLLWGPWHTEPFQIEWFVYAQLSSLLVTGLIAYWVVRRRMERIRLRFQPALWWLMLKKSFPFALVVFLMTIYTRVDAVMLERMLVEGEREAGIYASAYRLLDASNMFGFLFAGLLLPMFARMLKLRTPVQPLVRMSFQWIMAGALTLGLAVFFFRQEIMSLLYVGADAYWGEILGYLMIAFVAVSGSYIYGTLLTAHGSLRQMNILFVCSIFLNIGLNLWLIPTHQAGGAALATVVTQFVVFAGQVVLAHRLLRLPFEWSMFARVVFLGVVLGAGGWAIRQVPGWDWGLSFFSVLVLGFFASFLTGLIRIREMIQMLRTQG